MDVRVSNHFTREFLAEKADISPKYLYEIEIGQKGCSAYILYRLSEALDIRMDYLLTGKSTMGEDPIIIETLALFDVTQAKKMRKLLIIIYELIHFI